MAGNERHSYHYRDPYDVNATGTVNETFYAQSRFEAKEIERSTTPSSVISAPSSRGVNFSRPNTFYKNESPTSPSSENKFVYPPDEDAARSVTSSQYYSPSTSPTKLEFPRDKKEHSPTNSISSNQVHAPPPPARLSMRPVSNGSSLRSPVDLPASLQPPQRQSYYDDGRRMSQPNENVPPRTSSLKHGSNQEQKEKHKSSHPKPKKPAKICRKCGEPISGQFVRALGAAYHIDCFACADCGALCSSKFFPVEAPEEMQQRGITQIPLCERDYFKRLELLCYVCDGALRGSYITALGRKYHVEHFTCSMCSTVFGPEDSYYECQDSIYCHFHYSTLFASRCEGCQTSILKQFVEIYRSGREQQWHPECYMIFKFWNVKLSPEGAGPCINPLRPLSQSVKAPMDELSREQVVKHEQDVDKKVFRIWTMLCGYEEAGAAFISDMLQTASAGRFMDSLAATTRLVAKIEVLFTAIDSVCALVDPLIKQDELERGDGESNYTKLGKEAKTLCKKVVAFMSLISKSREKSVKRMGITQELLNLVTSLAHYLKLLIRFGLSNSLEYDRQNLDGHAVDQLLDQIALHEKTPANPLDNLGVTAMTSDHCTSCDLSIEDKCARIGDRRWHLTCLNCAACGTELGHTAAEDKWNLNEARWNSPDKRVYCSLCAPQGGRSGFVLVPKLRQFVFLLKIAVARLQLVLNAFDTRDKKQQSKDGESASTQSTTSPDSQASSSDLSQAEKGYMTTLTDIRRLRSTKLDQQVSESQRHARRSKILDMPDSEQARMSKNDSTHSLVNKASDLGSKPNNQRQIKIEDEKENRAKSRLDRTTDLFKNEKSLTLDDIPRIVAAEQARELRPNAYRHQLRNVISAQDAPETRNVSSGSRKEGQKRFISELSNVELFSVRHIAALLMEKMLNGWFTLEELFDLIEVKKTPSLWEKFGKAFGGSGGDKNKNKKKSGVFGVPLDFLVDKYGIDSTLGVGPGPLRIPAFIDDCITSMRQKDMSVEGVFRKNGNIRRLKDFSDKIDRQPEKTGILSEESPVQLAALLKKFLRELPEPLMTSKLLKLWISAQKLPDEEQRKRLLHLTCLLLPKTHRDVMEVLFFFLNWTASFSHVDEETGSKMDAHNLATVITPNILYVKENGQDKSNTSADGDSYFLSIESVNILIEEQSRFAEVPPEVLAILQHTNLAQATTEVTTKEIVSRYEQFMKDDGAQTVAAAASAARDSRTVSPSQNEQQQEDVPNNSQKNATELATQMNDNAEPMNNGGSRPAPIRVNTDLAQKMAHDHETYTSIKQVHDTNDENSPSSVTQSNDLRPQ